MSNALNPSESIVFNYEAPLSINDVRKELAAARKELEEVTIEYAKANAKVEALTKSLSRLLTA